MRGLERGIERVIGPVTVAVYVEIEAFIIYNLVKQMEQGVLDAAPVWTDIKTFPAKEFHGKIHGIIGGYPCQPFSTSGQRKGINDERHLWPHIEELINATKPVWCFFENVDDHLSLGFDIVLQSLSKMGYCVEAGVYTAQEIGAPHERKRLFFLAMADTYSNGTGTGPCKISDQSESIEGTQQRKNREWVWPQSRKCNKTLAYSTSKGLQIPRHALSNELSSKAESRLYNRPQFNGNELWPAGQGTFQYEWEHNRKIKPGLGCTVNGYNFRTDLLRMYGNGVVEQVAELAFITLLQKFNE